MLYDNAQLARVYLHAYQVRGNEFYKRVTKEILDYVIREMTDPNWGFYSSQDADSKEHEGKFSSGRQKHSYKDGQARLNGYLEDYANLAEGLLALYEATFNKKYFVAARELADQILAHFADPRGGFFDTSDDHETLVVRPKDVQDNATPSGGAMATMVLMKLGAYTGHPGYVDTGEGVVAPLQPPLAQAPTGFAWWLCA